VKVPIIYHVVLSGGYLQRVLIAGLEIADSKQKMFDLDIVDPTLQGC